MKKSMFLTEWKNVFTNKKLLISLTAVLFVPLMYAGMFLWAFWDPYAYLDKLPIAVINEDQGADFEGEHLEIGDELVENLKDLDELDFDIVSKKKGYQALENQEYYLLVEIPKDFSENATTLLDDRPEKLHLKYIPNESYNFLSSQIGETAVKEIQAEIAGEVSKTYAETMFDKLDEIADGFDEASDGSGKLDDGAVKLKDGSKELKANLEKLASKSIEFEDGVNTANDGSRKLAEGSGELANGVGQLTDASGQLLSASKKVQDGSTTLADGISEAHSGVKQMDENIPQLIDGTSQVQSGLTQFQNQLPKQMAGKIGAQLEESSISMLDGVNQLEQGVLAGVEQGVSKQMAPQLSKGLVEQLSGGLADQINQEINKNLANMPEEIASGISEQMTPEIIANQQQTVGEIFQVMAKVGIPEEQIQAVQKVVAQNQPDENAVKAQMKEQIKAGLAKNNGNSPTITEEQIEAGIKEPITAGVQKAADKTVAGIKEGVAEGFETYKTTVNEKLAGAAGGIETQIAKAVDPVFNQLNGGLTAIHNGQKTLYNGVNQLADGTQQLQTGANQLSSGQKEYVTNMQKYTNKMSEANQGANQLALGANDLSAGMNKLSDGSHQFNDASHKLADGSGDLSDGTKELQDGTKELHEKLDEAADEVGSLDSNEETYDMMGSPVKMDKEEINEVPNYGTGFAPYFISLGLFVGALLISIVLNLNDPIIEPKNAFTLFLSKFGMVAVVGVIQALILDGILLLGLGLKVTSVPLFILVTIITSLVFMTLVQFLSTTLGDPGRFIAIVILIMQLTTSAGTFPLELIPNVLQPINSLLPMTYSVQAFKAVVSSGDYSFMWQNMGVLIAYIVVAMGLTYTYFFVKSKKKSAAYEQQIEEAY